MKIFKSFHFSFKIFFILFLSVILVPVSLLLCWQTIISDAFPFVPVSLLSPLKFKIFIFLFFSLVVAVLTASVFVSFIIKKQSSVFSVVLDSAGSGETFLRAHDGGYKEFSSLAKSINSLSDNVAEHVENLTNEKDRLMKILSSMEEGVLVTDEMGMITLVNPSLQDMFGTADPLGKAVLEWVRNQSIHDAIEKVLAGERRNEQEIVIPMGLREKFFVVHTAPLGSVDNVTGSVSVFYDVTTLRELENMRKEFVANVSHELKTPLTNILGFAETLKSGAINDPQFAGRFVDKIEINAQQLKRLVEDILKLSAIEAGRYPLDKKEVELFDLVESLERFFEERLVKKGIVFNKRINSSVSLFVDANALRQILINLIDNAIQYSGEKSEVTVSAVQEENFWKITVSDNGIGLSAFDQEHVFERFYRSDKARSREGGGTGLGLAIVKHLVQAHGGEVGVTSEIGQGAQFYFTLPLSQSVHL